LFLATAFGVANGIWVFGPAFKEQRENEAHPKSLVVSEDVNAARVEELRDIEAAISHTSATRYALEGPEQPTSWWSNIAIWGRRQVNGDTNTKEAVSAAPTGNSQVTSNVPQKRPTADEALSRSPGIDVKDSVIGKLADRVANDPDLKVLVKTIAGGEASTEQLKRFQGYIDEIKRL